MAQARVKVARARVRALLRPTKARAVRRQMDNMAIQQCKAAWPTDSASTASCQPGLFLWGVFGGFECASWLGFTSHIDREPPLSNKTSVKQSQTNVTDVARQMVCDLDGQ